MYENVQTKSCLANTLKHKAEENKAVYKGKAKFNQKTMKVLSRLIKISKTHFA